MIAGGSLEIGAQAPDSAWRDAEEKIVVDFLAHQGLNASDRSRPFRGA